MNDRIRAKPPTTDVDAWTEAVVSGVSRAGGGYEVTVSPADGDSVVVTVSAAIFDLFTGRLDRAVDVPEDAVGATVWFRSVTRD